jgi:hypothetical protein
MAGYQTLKKTFSVKSDSKSIEQGSLARLNPTNQKKKKKSLFSVQIFLFLKLISDI